ncbi:MAG: hypothetical protein E4G99_10160 [Anaerolineales bacterium]|nr:MAG: hypothetical protein E4G99_10160 [Anaerolineales bacterium]
MIVRNFDWRDFALLQRVRNRGVCFHSRLNFTRGPHAMQNSLLEVLTHSRSTYSLVARPDETRDPEALCQVQILENYPRAHLAYVTPEEALDTSTGLHILDAAARFAGQRGCQTLVAEVDENSPGFETLRKARFGVYARQRIWRLDRASSSELEPQGQAWRIELNPDRHAIQALYLNIVPALVQQVEPPLERNGHGLVYWMEGELMGYLDLLRGPRGIWIQPYFHPAAQLSDDLLAGFIQGFSPSPGRPVYVCVRSYQGGVGGSLDRLGFKPCYDQAVMVKRLAHLVANQVQAKLPAIEGTQPEPTAPFAHFDHPVRPKQNTKL